MAIRLLKMVIQPVFVVDDGTHLTEKVGDVFVIGSADIPTFPDKWEDAITRMNEEESNNEGDRE